MCLIILRNNSCQIAVRAGGFSAMVVVGMAVIGVAILYATFYVWLGVGLPGSMKVTDCKCILYHSMSDDVFQFIIATDISYSMCRMLK